ncbi:MAG: heme lyase CcmF/NrfE family subunit [Ignavibacteriae bacterium]|nr:MAG: heme lyase CcmF/NrfE family subunit [Ignavibacteriota bacterium]
MGSILIFIAFASALLASVSYFSAHFGKTNAVRFGRFFFHVAAIATISSAAFLLYLIITHQFQYTYVWNYSSRDLPFNLLLSTFYAGQEGSFHLWAFLMALIGIFLVTFVSKRDGAKDRYEPQVMAVFTLLQSFLLFILIVKSPYEFVWQSFPGDVQVGFVPPDGRGLNPLLQNFWMTIHPPILFAGFSALAVPFSFAVAALMKNDYTRWLKLAMPWTLFAGMVLGLGIMLGGYWAYGVLGWGGYWGWDPVENSSLVPWIIIVAAIHTMISEQTTGRFKKTNLLLCMLAFIFVLYSTFLTRSGILGDASVHSFVDPGQEVYLFLVVFLSLFSIGGIGLIIFRMKSLAVPKEEKSTELLSRETALFIGTITLCAAALVIAVGTSWPIISKGTVDPSFYNKMNLPLAILIAAINGFSILLKWKNSDEKQFIKSLYMPVILTAAATITLVIFGLDDVLMGVFAAASLFALFINADNIFRMVKTNSMKAGPYVAHLGIMVLFLGVIGSAQYSQEENVSLPIGEPKEVLGYKLTYLKATPFPDDPNKYHFNVAVEKDGKSYWLQPVMFYSDYNQGVMKNPDYAALLTKDIYISPMGLEVPEKYAKDDKINIKKGETADVKGLKVKFIDFDRSKFNRDDMASGKENIIAAELEVTDGTMKETIIAEQHIHEGESEPVEVQLSGNTRFSFFFTQMNLQEEAQVEIAVVDNLAPKKEEPAETLVATASIKPFISFVWVGTGIMVLGFFFSIVNRYRKLRQENETIKHISGNGHESKVHTNGGNKKPHSKHKQHA